MNEIEQAVYESLVTNIKRVLRDSQSEGWHEMSLDDAIIVNGVEYAIRGEATYYADCYENLWYSDERGPAYETVCDIKNFDIYDINLYDDDCNPVDADLDKVVGKIDYKKLLS